ncbi:retron St85 family RNA-directed DNA polymerase [Aeromonas salmonicida]|uniref:retron St85 family RNA-directed DNA polymerase n=1 Tax=Aeromonas salmonicida TaxID=645 RepID=UPI003D42C39E
MQLIENICSELNIDYFQIKKFSSSAPKMYKVYTIPKRRSGHRVIAHPSRELKKYQRVLLSLFENKLPIHHAAFAYRKGISIRDNANMHKNNAYLLKMDFYNFFNSITPDIFWSEMDKIHVKISKRDRAIINGLVFWNPSKKKGGKLLLSVGAPTSPIISNFIMSDFDTAIYEICKKSDITYTRYADDLTFSSNKKMVLFDIPLVIKKILSIVFNGELIINEQKTVFSSKAHNRHVTGVTITNDQNLSIGRERKKYIYHLLHQFSLGKLNEHDILHLGGLFSFACHIDHSFAFRANKKYGRDLIDKLTSYRQGKENE